MHLRQRGGGDRGQQRLQHLVAGGVDVQRRGLRQGREQRQQPRERVGFGARQRRKLQRMRQRQGQTGTRLRIWPQRVGQALGGGEAQSLRPCQPDKTGARRGVLGLGSVQGVDVEAALQILDTPGQARVTHRDVIANPGPWLGPMGKNRQGRIAQQRLHLGDAAVQIQRRLIGLKPDRHAARPRAHRATTTRSVPWRRCVSVTASPGGRLAGS